MPLTIDPKYPSDGLEDDRPTNDEAVSWDAPVFFVLINGKHDLSEIDKLADYCRHIFLSSLCARSYIHVHQR
jgi:hypothetical protein